MTRQTDSINMIEAATPTSLFTIARQSISAFLLLTIITGIVYPLAITGLAKTLFLAQAEGSLIDSSGNYTTDPAKAVGSRLIGQTFDQPQYFWSRPSATSPISYNAAASTGSNIGPSAIAATVKPRVDALKAADPTQSAPVPIDLVTASGSGLDPHISLAAAEYQLPRVAKARNLDAHTLQSLIDVHTITPDFGALGEKVVNVLELNLALDKLAPYTVPTTASQPTK